MKRLARGMAAAVVACMVAWPMIAGARPVNPASGWLLDIEAGAGAVDQDLSGEPHFLVSSPLGSGDLTLATLDERYIAVDQSTAGAMLGLGYGWPGFYFQLLLGVNNVTVKWDVEKLSTGAKKYEMEAQGAGPAFGLRVGGRLWRGEKAALHVGASAAISVEQDVTVNQKNVATGGSQEYMADNPLITYDASMVSADAGVDLTFSYTLGNFVPWASIGSRAQSSILSMKTSTNILGVVIETDLQDFNAESASTFASALGVNWNFNRNGTMWIAGNLTNPSGVMLGLTLCSGAR